MSQPEGREEGCLLLVAGDGGAGDELSSLEGVELLPPPLHARRQRRLRPLLLRSLETPVKLPSLN